MAELAQILTNTDDVSSLLPTDAVNLVRNGELYKAPATLFKGDKGDNGVDGTNGTNGTNGANGVGVPSGGSANQVLAKNGATDFDTHWVDPPSNSNAIDLTSASSDYALGVGETAVITYTSATSVPLHVSISGGEYEISLLNTLVTITSSLSELRPNNTTYADMFRAPGSSPGSSNPDSFSLGMQGIRYGRFFINTLSKIFYGKSIGNNASAYAYTDIALTWEDSVAWTSLGTVIYPSSHTGKIVIKRII